MPIFNKMFLNPNCSEIILRLCKKYTRKELIRKLSKIGIYVTDIPRFWPLEGRTLINALIDRDNIMIPDFVHYAVASLNGHKNGVWEVWFEQHCQIQLYPTIKKITENFKYTFNCDEIYLDEYYNYLIKQENKDIEDERPDEKINEDFLNKRNNIMEKAMMETRLLLAGKNKSKSKL